jgi:hypothetical protein
MISIKMKKLFIVSIASLVFISANTQGNYSLPHTDPGKLFHPVKYGVDAGASIARIKGNGFDDSRQMGYFFGGFVQVYISKAIALQGEINFSRSGAKTSNNFNEVYANADAKNSGRQIYLDYVQIPLLVNIPFGYSRLRLQLGPQFSKYVGHKALFQTSTKTFNDGEVAAVCGIWYEYAALNVHARYLLGLSNVNAYTSSNNWQTRILQFGVGITL